MAIFEAYPHELSHLKFLLLRRQYRPCINASIEALKSHEDCDDDKHPLTGLFATFYLALAHDELARSMHEHSSFKLPTFEKAEKHYNEAINLLPSLEQCSNILSQHYRKAAQGEAMRSQILGRGTELFISAASALALVKSAYDAPAEKDDSDMESEDSLDDLLESDVPRLTLPRRPLERDYSSMSLLTARPRLTKSVSQGLLRPIRPGSPPKAFHLPPKLPFFGQDHSSQSSRSPSPLPRTPDIAVEAPATECSETLEEPFFDLTGLSEHLDGMHTQLTTHIALLHRAKLATTVAQADRASRSGATENHQQKRIPQSKSFWSFTPVNVMLADKQKKIEEGRARGWERKRYTSERYETLMDDALAEL